MKKEYKVNVAVDSVLLQQVNKWLTARAPEEFQNENNTVSVTAVFPDGCEMDIKCCGCQSEPSWTEAVLFNAKGGELCCTDPSDRFAGEWKLEHDETSYIATLTEG